MKLLKSILALFMAVGLTACSTQTGNEEPVASAEPIKVLAPMGAPALSLLGLYGNENVTIDTVDGSDVIRAELAKADSEYDAIIAPINLGATLLSKGKSEFLLDSAVTWGNLYIVGTDENALESEGVFAAFGEQSVPQKVLESSMDLESLPLEVTYFGSANEVQAQLLTDKANVGMLAEPAATATIAKAKEKGLELKIIKDLQEAYKEQNNMDQVGYPQAALFVKKGSEEKVASYIEEASDFVENATDETIAKAVETATVEKLGVPSAEIVQKTWERQNIHFKKAADIKTDIDTFLKQFSITLTEEAYSK
ncbi:hypothetical protein WKT02_08940 [Erysipelotrichaceae bacterium HCN-30851]